jgi:hypothetical protein
MTSLSENIAWLDIIQFVIVKTKGVRGGGPGNKIDVY